MSNIRIYQLAKELGVSPKSLQIAACNLGFDVRSHMNSLDAAQADALRKTVCAPPSRVVRDERGVIVGAAPARGPKILGFIKVPTRTKTRRDAGRRSAPKPTVQIGRASLRDAREAKVRNKNYRNAARGRTARNRRRLRANHTAAMRPENRVLKINGSIRIDALAHAMATTAAQVIGTGWRLGLTHLRPQQRVDAAAARTLAEAFDWGIVDVGFNEAVFVRSAGEMTLDRRAPVVTVMGHVDHGKTSLLDAVRNTRVAQGEAGGITQHIGASRLVRESGDIIFIDTPGHEAWAAMRGRGAAATDIVVLVVAADDGVMPTTVEAIAHARSADVPVVVAINKMDAPGADAGRVKQQLMAHDLVAEEFGGDTSFCELSALTGDGVEALLETLTLTAEMMDLRAPQEGRARGTVLEGRIRKGHGPTCTLLVQAGTLRVGDILVAGGAWGKVRRLLDDQGKPVECAGPSTPVTVIGLDAPARAGEPAVVVRDDAAARRIHEHRIVRARLSMAPSNLVRMDEYLRNRDAKVLPIIIKAGVAGSIEALAHVLDGLDVGDVSVDIVRTGLGAVTEGDVKLAAACGAVVLGFNVKSDRKAEAAARGSGVAIETRRVVYELADAVQQRMMTLLDPVFEERPLGTLVVRQVFNVTKTGTVAGGRVTDGALGQGAQVRVVREGAVLFEGELGSLRVHKNDVARVGVGRECGVTVAGFGAFAEGDRIEAYERVQVVADGSRQAGS